MPKFRSLISNMKPPTLIDYLYENHKFESMSDVRRLIVKGKVYVNGLINKNPESNIGKNDVVEMLINASFTEELTIPETVVKKIAPRNIIFQNDEIAIVNKGKKDTMDLETPGNLGQKLAIRLNEKGENTSHLAHMFKLDDETKGIVIYAKTNNAFLHLNDVIKSKEMECTYYAITIPTPFMKEKKHFELTSPLVRDEYNKYQKAKRPKEKKECLIIDVVGGISIKKQDYPIVRIKTRQIRRSDIRFLMAFYGMPIMNDKKLAGHKISDDLILFCQKIRLPEKSIDAVGETTFSIDKEIIIGQMKKSLEVTLKKGYV